MYQFFKDFAAPIATLIAASVAAFVTITFARTQALIAKSQRDIALDKLKFDLFQKRYEIYEATKELIEYVPFVTDLEKSDTMKIRSLYVKIDEARFYFPPDICTLLDTVHARCELFFTHLAERARININAPGADAEWSRQAEILTADQTLLREIYASLPKAFEPSLAFEQLKRA